MKKNDASTIMCKKKKKALEMRSLKAMHKGISKLA